MRVNLLSALLLSVGVLILAAGCATTQTQKGALIGGTLGAGAGAIIGHQSGHAGEGALIGAAAGGLTGALVGDKVEDNQQKKAAQGQRPAGKGHYETRIVTTTSGETYEERVWVPDQ